MEVLDSKCEKFLGGPSLAYSERVHVTINRKGKIFLNQKAHKIMGKALAVYLYYNREKHMIILERTDALRARDAFLLREVPGSGRCIWASPFCKHFRIRVDGTVRFLSPEVDPVGRMFLKLRDTVNVSVGPRPRKK